MDFCGNQRNGIVRENMGYSTYIFVIDTEQYAGYFERELCAWCTGRKEEYFHEWTLGYADECVKLKPVQWFDDLLNNSYRHPDAEHDTIVHIEPTPGWWNDGMGKHYRDGEGPDKKDKYPAYLSVGISFYDRPTDEQLEFMMKRARAFEKEQPEGCIGRRTKIDVTGFRLLKRTVTYDSETLTG